MFCWAEKKRYIRQVITLCQRAFLFATALDWDCRPAFHISCWAWEMYGVQYAASSIQRACGRPPRGAFIMSEPEAKPANSTVISEVDVLWVTAGLGCDGDTIAMTAATQPSIEEVVLGGIPWIPKVNFHNPFLAMANGDEFLEPFHRAAKGTLGPYILVVEGSIPDETNKKEGYWASMGTDKATGQPILTCD